MRKNNSLDPRGRARRRIAIFRRKISKYIRKNSITDEEADVIRAFLAEKGRSALLLLSDLEARLEASDQFSRIFLRHREENPGHRYYFFTFTDEAGLISDRCTIVDLKEIMSKAGRALRSLGVNAVAVLEVHPLANYPGGGAGRTLMFHVHAIGWAGDTFDAKEAEQILIAGGAWMSGLGAPAVKIQPITSDAEDLEEVSRYILKAPHSAKNRMPRKKDPTRFRLMDTIKGYRPEFAFRVLEVLSQIEMLTVVVGVGDGKRIRQDFRKGMADWHRKRAVDSNLLPGEFDIWHFWLRLRESTGSKLFLPVRITGGGYRMRSVKQASPKKQRRKGLSLPSWHKKGAPQKRKPTGKRR
jgi:hypothetical protein